MTAAAHAATATGRAVVPAHLPAQEIAKIALPGRAKLEMDVAARLIPLARHWRLAMDKALVDQPVTAITAQALVTLHQLGDRARQTDLAAAINTNSATLVRLVDELVGSGLVTRESDGADRRVRRVSLTECGQAVVTKVEIEMRALRHRTLLDFPDETLLMAVHLLHRLDRAICP